VPSVWQHVVMPEQVQRLSLGQEVGPEPELDPDLEPELEPELDPDVAPEDVAPEPPTKPAQPPLVHVEPTAVQFWQGPPDIPHEVSSVPGEQVPAESQQPLHMPGAPHDPPLTPLPALPLPPGVPLWPTLPLPPEPLPEPEPLPLPAVAPELVPESRKSVPVVLEPPQAPVTRANAIQPASRMIFRSFVLRVSRGEGAPRVPRAGIVFKKDLALLQREREVARLQGHTREFAVKSVWGAKPQEPVLCEPRAPAVRAKARTLRAKALTGKVYERENSKRTTKYGKSADLLEKLRPKRALGNCGGGQEGVDK
jgi:hypothetical protein